MKNTVFLGILLGVICPALAFVLTRYSNIPAQLFPDKPTALYILAAGVNLICCYICYKKDLEKTGNGFVLITFLGMLLMVVTKTLSVPGT